uniref:Macaca fascicularis brain cDNA clone: QtrA-16414, similar to human myotubularin related protein 9 (MTMR9), mRNA, RefSeq: NM_015458.3 n=1 Tax=Macaca fascicularis TaxID=9541 RepID=I7GEQ7_MACFA|nr:unnamed protein product [Macaca fascicularis]
MPGVQYYVILVLYFLEIITIWTLATCQFLSLFQIYHKTLNPFTCLHSPTCTRTHTHTHAYTYIHSFFHQQGIETLYSVVFNSHVYVITMK